MKQALFVFIGILLTLTVSAQIKRQSVAIYTSLFGTGSTFTRSIGGASMEVNHTFLTGAEYGLPLNTLLSIHFGLEYADHAITSKGAPMPNQSITKGHIELISIPIYLQADLFKYFFFSFGAVIDHQVKNDLTNSISGVGITGGTGIKYDFKNRMTIFIHPFYQLRRIGSGNSNLITGGLRTGVAFRF